MQTKRKTMIVTGAAKGIGAGVTNAFIERGYNVVANSLNITASTLLQRIGWLWYEVTSAPLRPPARSLRRQ